MKIILSCMHTETDPSRACIVVSLPAPNFCELTGTLLRQNEWLPVTMGEERNGGDTEQQQ